MESSEKQAVAFFERLQDSIDEHGIENYDAGPALLTLSVKKAVQDGVDLSSLLHMVSTAYVFYSHKEKGGSYERLD